MTASHQYNLRSRSRSTPSTEDAPYKCKAEGTVFCGDDLCSNCIDRGVVPFAYAREDNFYFDCVCYDFIEGFVNKFNERIGEWKGFYPYEAITLHYHRGVLEGEVTITYINTTKPFVKDVGYMLHGKKHGVWTKYYSEGTKYSEVTFTHGLYNGPYIFWDPQPIEMNGKTYRQIQEGYHKNDHMHGVWTTWYCDDKFNKLYPILQKEYDMDKKVNRWKEWNPLNGKLKVQTFYYNDD